MRRRLTYEHAMGWNLVPDKNWGETDCAAPPLQNPGGFRMPMFLPNGDPYVNELPEEVEERHERAVQS